MTLSDITQYQSLIVIHSETKCCFRKDVSKVEHYAVVIFVVIYETLKCAMIHISHQSLVYGIVGSPHVQVFGGKKTMGMPSRK